MEQKVGRLPTSGSTSNSDSVVELRINHRLYLSAFGLSAKLVTRNEHTNGRLVPMQVISRGKTIKLTELFSLHEV